MARDTTPDPVREAIPLRWWSDSQLQRLAECVGGALASWRSEWLPGEPACAPQAALLAHDQAADDAWTALGVRGNSTAWIANSAIAKRGISTVLFDDLVAHPHSRIATRIAADAWDALLVILQASLHLGNPPAPIPPPKAAFSLWSGYVALPVAVTGGASLTLLLNSGCMSAAVGEVAADAYPAAPPLTPLMHAISNRRVPVRVELEGCQLHLGALQDLRVGDIVRLPHPLDAPLHISVAERRLCSGFLGRRDGRRAIELLRLDTGVANTSIES